MREELYVWMKNLAVFYIVLTSMLHLVPGKEYQRYIRLFMGLVLVLMICRCFFSILGKGEDMIAGFQENYRRENQIMDQKEAEKLQSFYLEKGYIWEVKEKIKTALEKRKILPAEIQVTRQGEEILAVIYLEKTPNKEQEEAIADGLMEACQLHEGQYQIKIAAYGSSAVAGASSAGTSAGSSGDAGFQ